jgi:flavin-dependent dehydrogenase
MAPHAPRATPRRPIRSVAVIGGGPAGSYLAERLASAGLRVALLTRSKHPPLVVGESLVPAIVPFLRDLAIEDEVASYSTYKPGATFTLNPGDELFFTFAEVPSAITNYSYNVPRDRFDASFLDAARRAGAAVFDVSARVETDGSGPEARVRLSDATLAALGGWFEGWSGQYEPGSAPDLVVDASGRARLLASALDLASEPGPRKDTALFAHLEGVPLRRAGDVHTDRLERGWCWRIPLPGRTSVGIVAPTEHIQKFGDTIEDQYEGLLRKDPLTTVWAGGAKRLTPVVKYNNYQLTTLAGYGPDWALVGDAFGFIDPVFSSGLLVGLDGARLLARTILRGTPRAWQRYEAHVIDHLAAWRRIVDYYYDGRLFTLFRVGAIVEKTPIGGLVNRHFMRHMPRIFTGEATTRLYSRKLLDFMCRYGLYRHDPAQLRVG